MGHLQRTPLSGIQNNNTVPRTWSSRPDKLPLRVVQRTRRYNVTYLGNNSNIMDFTRVAPALPEFEGAFCAIARGTLIATDTGPVAVEDLLPGDRVCTHDNGPQTLQWIGSMAIAPHETNQTEGMGNLARINADSFGLGRPMPDLVLGPRARLLRHDAALVSALGTTAALAPITAFIDGDTILKITPATPVRVFHLAFSSHQIICANGLEIESYHPGKMEEIRLNGDMQAQFIAMFPHIRMLSDFGPLAYPRMSRDAALKVLAA